MSSPQQSPKSNLDDRDSRHEPLAGVRVIDFSMIMSGPMCTRALADAGADVVKIEPPAGDMLRKRPPHRSDISTYFASMNCGKRSVVVDLSTVQGREIALRLSDQADVVVENFRPGVMKRLGLDFETVAARNPRLIYCSISGFGQAGPRAHQPAFAPVIHASSGFDLTNMAYQRNPDRPANNGVFVADVLAAAHATSAIHLALYDREKTGRGQHIDLSMMDSIVGMLTYEIQLAQDPASKLRPVYQPVRSRDGFVMVAAVMPKFLPGLFEAIDFPEGLSDPRFATAEAGEANWIALLDIIEAWTSERSGAECEATLMRAGVPCAKYRTVAEAIADPQATFRGSFERVGSSSEPFLVANQPYKLSGSVIRARQRLPQLGEHTNEVIAETLGTGAGEIERPARSGELEER
ncbi:CoA transferase [Bradyrhizobium sp. Pear76]|uniref:CaiB/BaiF CoA transferase family protein n=1 Tax=Bradyrhizobium oropedii TaxID=1571201 RepID=UPI001E5F42F2|nr:CoA transferase [Bradyrhizobium oropedii]MCC8967095.1 CoA transferase [Bradyrhizobium oropedii]